MLPDIQYGVRHVVPASDNEAVFLVTYFMFVAIRACTWRHTSHLNFGKLNVRTWSLTSSNISNRQFEISTMVLYMLNYTKEYGQGKKKKTTITRHFFFFPGTHYVD